MRLTIIRLLFIVLLYVVCFYALAYSDFESLVLAFVTEYIVEPFISEKLR